MWSIILCGSSGRPIMRHERGYLLSLDGLPHPARGTLWKYKHPGRVCHPKVRRVEQVSVRGSPYERNPPVIAVASPFPVGRIRLHGRKGTMYYAPIPRGDMASVVAAKPPGVKFERDQ